jgi:hypothetical protein
MDATFQQGKKMGVARFPKGDLFLMYWWSPSIAKLAWWDTTIDIEDGLSWPFHASIQTKQV